MITNPQSVQFSNVAIRPFADKLAQLYEIASVILTYWNANGGSGLANPSVNPTVAQSTGGSFAAATYSWKYTFVNARGETLASGNVTLAVTLNNKVTVTVPSLPAGATQTNIYRGTVVGSEGLVGNTVTTSFVDTGATTPGVQAPTSNTSGLIPNDSEIIQDGSATDGRSQMTGAQAVNIINRVTDITNFMNGSVAVSSSDGSKIVLGTVLMVAVNPSASLGQL